MPDSPKPTEKLLVLLSGGLDSAANLAFAIRRGYKVVRAITFDYGQKAARSELKASRALCAHYDVPHECIELPWLGKLGGNALTSDSVPVPTLTQDTLDNKEITKASAAKVWVPNRNGVFLNIGASIAESLQADIVLTGFNHEEAATFPDNSPDFLLATNNALKYSTKSPHVRANSMSVFMNKTEIAQALHHLPDPFPWKHVWSCYYSGEKPCGECESCQRFQRAMQNAQETLR